MATGQSAKPVRSYFEEKGFTVSYDPATKEAIISGPGGTERFKGEVDPSTGRMYGEESRLAAIAERLSGTGGGSPAGTSSGGSLPPAGDRVVRGLSSEDILDLLSRPEGESPPPKSIGGFGSGWYLGPGGELYLPSRSSVSITAAREDPWVAALTQKLAALESENAALRSEVAGLRDAVGQLYNNPYASSPPQSSSPSSSPQQSPSPPPPATIPAEVKVEGVTPAGPGPSAAESQAAAAKSPGSTAGFEREVFVPLGIPTPSVDRLMELWREVTGREEPAMREYFQHPQFQRVLAGKVPVWMAADPTWRLFLMRLGLIKKRLGEQ